MRSYRCLSGGCLAARPHDANIEVELRATGETIQSGGVEWDRLTVQELAERDPTVTDDEHHGPVVDVALRQRRRGIGLGGVQDLERGHGVQRQDLAGAGEPDQLAGGGVGVAVGGDGGLRGQRRGGEEEGEERLETEVDQYLSQFFM